MHITILTQNSKLDSINFFKKFLVEHIISFTSDALSIESTELVIIRNHGMDYKDCDLDIVEKAQTKFLNPPKSLKLLRDKFEVYRFLKAHNINHLNTTQDYHELSYPMVMKTLRGMKGYGVYLVNNEDELFKIKGEDKRFIFQEYIKYKKEYRYIYFLGKHILLENTSGNFKDYDQYLTAKLSKEWLNIFDSIRKTLSLNFFSVDCFELNNKMYVVDINGVPGTKLIERHLSLTELLECQENLPFI